MLSGRFHRLRRSLAVALGIFFALQVAFVVPMHNAHGSLAHSERSERSAPDEGRCDFFVAFNVLDLSSLAKPPVLELQETAFAVVAAYASFEYSHPDFFSLARGPPSFTA